MLDLVSQRSRPRQTGLRPAPSPKLVFGGSKRLRNFIFGPQEGWGVLFFFFLMTLQHIKSAQGLEHPDRVSMETKPVSGPGPAWPYPPSLGLLAENWGPLGLGQSAVGKVLPLILALLPA